MSHICQWKKFILHCFLIIHSFVFVNSNEIGQIPFCPPHSSLAPPRSLVFVSTLDGQLSALDANDNGKKLWSLDYADMPMLSSNIHRRELNNNGQWVRLIPSLKGSLYKFDGENLEIIPVTTEKLLQSSYRYSDDLIFSGGKETRSYGISSLTGEILYECKISGCTNNTENENHIAQGVLIVRRYQQTVRAIEPRTGTERWNFSVGQNELVLIPRQNVECHNSGASFKSDFEIKVIMPEGLIWAVSKSNPSAKLWQYKFDSPIVSVWQEDESKNDQSNNGLREVDLFDSSQWTWGSGLSDSPGIYLGMHNKQLYVQENTDLLKKLGLPKSSKSFRHPRIPWQPYPAIGYAVADEKSSKLKSIGKGLNSETEEASSTTALSVLYNSEYINGNGFYLYMKAQLDIQSNHQCNNTTDITIEMTNNSSDEASHENETPVQVIIVSLWYWWKEVMLISITTAILVNCMFAQRLLSVSSCKDTDFPPLIVERHVEVEKRVHKTSEGSQNESDFKSRFFTDFEPIDCLGKGGYGIVFEAKNKIDDCNYAIKRITLPNSSGSRERVMREVKALAKLDHHNIVRYFNAWLECPPAGWQKEYDDHLRVCKLKSPSLEFSLESTQTETKSNHCLCIDVPQTDPSSADSALEAYKLNDQTQDEDSFIFFERSNHHEPGVAIDIHDENNTESSEISLSHEGIEKTCKKDDSGSSESIVFQDSDNQSLINIQKHKKREQSRLSRSKSESIDDKSAKMYLYIQMQLCQRLSLREWLKEQNNQRDYVRILDIFQQIVNAVEYVHLQGLIHRDLKPSNIFFALDDKIKIGDFGLVTAMTGGCKETCNYSTIAHECESIRPINGFHTACVGTHLYMSPEQMNGQMYNYKVDIYSLGIIFFELLIPFLTDMERVVSLVNLKKSNFPQEFDVQHPAEYNLLKLMLNKDPEKRPTTLGIKARPPLLKYETKIGLNVDGNEKWHFNLPSLTRHSSVTNSSSSGESWENIS